MAAKDARFNGGFLVRQVTAVRGGGPRVLFRKAAIVLLLPLAGLTAIFVYAISPLILVRFGRMHSRAIGHFAINPEIYLCERDAGMHGQRGVDVFYLPTQPPNRQLEKMWRRTIHMTNFPFFVGLVDRLSQWLPGGKRHAVPWRRGGDRDIYGVLARSAPHLSFIPSEDRRAGLALEALGLPKDAPFICFSARDSAYKKVNYPDKDWGYHDYRNADIRNYVPAAGEMASRGYFAIRMGATVESSLDTTNPMIIDYASSGRSDFLDIYLLAQCRFFLSSGAGLASVSQTFRRPVAWANYIPLEYAPSWGPNDVFIPKKLWLSAEQRFMSFREIIESGAGRLSHTDEYRRLGIHFVENTPEEITDLAIEMHERLEGRWRTTEEDEVLQRKFRCLFKPSALNRVFESHIGAEFLRQHRELLD